jgi:hypothetical protein
VRWAFALGVPRGSIFEIIRKTPDCIISYNNAIRGGISRAYVGKVDVHGGVADFSVGQLLLSLYSAVTLYGRPAAVPELNGRRFGDLQPVLFCAFAAFRAISSSKSGLPPRASTTPVHLPASFLSRAKSTRRFALVECREQAQDLCHLSFCVVVESLLRLRRSSRLGKPRW